METVDYTYDAVRQHDRGSGDAGRRRRRTTQFAYDGWNPDLPTPIGNENMNVWATVSGGSAFETQYLWSDKVDGLSGEVYLAVAPAPRWVLHDRLRIRA